jgi:hypothetical protein
MLESQTHRNTPAVPLSLAVAAPLKRALDTTAPLQEAMCREIAQGVADILHTLGIPGAPRIQITALEEEPAFASRFLRLLAHEHLCPYADELLQRVQSYVCGIPLSPVIKPDHFLEWLCALLDTHAEDTKTNPQVAAEFLRVVCLEMITAQPAVLLGPAQVVAYQASLPASANGPDVSWPPDPYWLRPILAEVLNLKVSIADTQRVATVLKAGLAKGQSQAALVEDLFVALQTDVVEIQLPPGYLRQITMADENSEHDKFALMRDGLFYELGIRYPRFSFALCEHLKPNSFTFKINHLTTLPWIGLPPDYLLVSETTEKLQLFDISGQAALNPANAQECSLMNVSSRHDAEALGLQTWNPMEYLVLCFSTSVRENSPCFTHCQAVQEHLDQLEQAFPALVQAAQAKVSLVQLTRVLRALSAEELSIRDLRAILECVLDYDHIVTDLHHYIIFDDRLPTTESPDETGMHAFMYLTSYIRAGLKRYISHKYTRGSNTLIVYLLDPEIEEMLLEQQVAGRGAQQGPLSSRERDEILEAVRAETGTLPSTSVHLPAILTSIDIRPLLRAIMAAEFPRMPVLAYQELSPDLNIQPIARLALRL